MSISQTDKIDIISTGKNGRIVLTITDDLEWDEEGNHALLMEEKINNYLHFIESGQLPEAYPDAKGKKVIIAIRLQHQPDEEGLDFLEECREIVKGLGHKLEWNNPGGSKKPQA